MPILDIEGQRITVGDEFLSLPPEKQQSTVEEIAASLKPKEASKVGATDVVRSAASGVPVLGGLANKLNAATNAALAPVVEPFLSKGPDTLDQPTYSERYQKSLDIQNARDAKFAQEHPVVDIGAKLAGGAASLGAAALRIPGAASALGMEGTLPAMVTKGALSGAGIGAADAATRGEDVVHGAEVGGAFGAGGPLVARGIGKVASAFMPKPPITPQAKVEVGGVEVPLRPDQVSGDVAAAAEAEAALRGAKGDKAQAIAQEFDTAQKTKIREAGEEISASLDPSGASRSTAPQAAGAKITDELIDAETRRLAAEQNATARATAEGEQVRALGAPIRTVDSPYAAAETIGAGVQNAAQTSRATRTAAYRDYAAVPGEYEPAGFSQIGNSIRQRLSSGDSPVRVTENLTPRAHEALNILDENVGTLRFQNDAATGAQVPRPITGQTVEEARKELTTLYGDARRAAMGPGGSQADVRAMDRIITAFDNHVTELATNGGFSGDAQALLAAGERARASHAAYRQNFTKQGPNDEVGPKIEKIIGRYEGQAATPDQIAQMSYGSVAEPGGGDAMKVAQRLRSIFGENSPEWTAYKQGLVSHILDTPPGTAARAPSQVADRIERFLDGTKGRGLSQVALSAEERAALRTHADTLRASEPRAINSGDSVEKIISRISGRDGGTPMTPGEVVDQLFGRSGKGDKGVGTLLAQRLKRDLSPDGWTAVRQGMWEKITNAGEGKIPFEAQALSQRIHEFLNESGKGMAAALFSPAERAEMAKLAAAYRQMIPPKGTTNPSGSGFTIARIANKASTNLGAMLGLVHGGIPGMAVGMGMEKGFRGLANARNARETSKLFYGEQPKVAASSSRVPIVLSQGAAPTVANQ